MAICDTYLTEIKAAYTTAKWMHDTYIDAHCAWLTSYYSTSGFNLNWRTHVALAICNIALEVENLVYANNAKTLPLRIPYYLENCIGGEFDMDTLLSTMLQAEPDQVQYFVGLVDAYRQSIWNQPFNEEFFAALARGFEQWP